MNNLHLPPARNARRLLMFAGFMAIMALLFFPVRYYNHSLFSLLNCSPDNFVGGYFMLLMTTLVDGFFVLIFTALLYPWYQNTYARFLIIFFLTTLFIHALKNYFDFPRPLALYGEGKICRWGMPLYSRSFPSGHSMAAASLLLFLAQRGSLRLKVLFALFCLAGAFSRVYIGAHFPADIWLGFWIALLIIFPVLYIMPVKPASHRKTHLHNLRHAGVATWGLTICLLYLFAYPEKTKEWEFLLTPLVSFFALIFVLRLVFYLWQYRIDATS